MRATPDPPFPTRAFSQRIGSKPVGATPRRPARTKSFLLAHHPRNTRKSTRFSANSRASPVFSLPRFPGKLFSSHFPFFLEFHRWPRTLVGCRRARHVLWQCRSTGLFRHSTPKREVARLSRFQSQNCFVSQLRHTSLLAYYLVFLVDDVETMSRVIQLGYFWKFSNIYNEQINIRERKEK